jgi:hypothetical protein
MVDYLIIEIKEFFQKREGGLGARQAQCRLVKIEGWASMSRPNEISPRLGLHTVD